MNAPKIGRWYGATPERMTLSEVKRWEAKASCWAQARRALQFLGLL